MLWCLCILCVVMLALYVLSISRLLAWSHPVYKSQVCFWITLIASWSLSEQAVKFPLLVSLDIDQWNKVTELLGTPSESFLNQLQPSVSNTIQLNHTTVFSSFKQIISTSTPQECVGGMNGIYMCRLCLFNGCGRLIYHLSNRQTTVTIK